MDCRQISTVINLPKTNQLCEENRKRVNNENRDSWDERLSGP